MDNKVDLTAQLSANLKTYDAEIREGVRKSVEKNTEELRDELKRNSPRRRSKRKRQGKYRSGSYARSWSERNVENNFSTYVKEVYNKMHSQLTHLLENGHAKRGGGRVSPRVHIAPAEQRAKNNFENDIKKLIKTTE